MKLFMMNMLVILLILFTSYGQSIPINATQHKYHIVNTQGVLEAIHQELLQKWNQYLTFGQSRSNDLNPSITTMASVQPYTRYNDIISPTDYQSISHRSLISNGTNPHNNGFQPTIPLPDHRTFTPNSPQLRNGHPFSSPTNALMSKLPHLQPVKWDPPQYIIDAWDHYRNDHDSYTFLTKLQGHPMKCHGLSCFHMLTSLSLLLQQFNQCQYYELYDDDNKTIKDVDALSINNPNPLIDPLPGIPNNIQREQQSSTPLKQPPTISTPLSRLQTTSTHPNSSLSSLLQLDYTTQRIPDPAIISTSTPHFTLYAGDNFETTLTLHDLVQAPQTDYVSPTTPSSRDNLLDQSIRNTINADQSTSNPNDNNTPLDNPNVNPNEKQPDETIAHRPSPTKTNEKITSNDNTEEGNVNPRFAYRLQTQLPPVPSAIAIQEPHRIDNRFYYAKA